MATSACTNSVYFLLFQSINLVLFFQENKKIVHVSHKSDQKKRSNGAFLICAYMVGFKYFVCEVQIF